MSSSDSPVPVIPRAISLPRHLPANLNVFTMRHGERVDQAFGNDWVEQAFKLHRKNGEASKGEDEIPENPDDLPDPSPSDSASASASASDSESDYSAFAEFSSRLSFPFSSLHHCTYVRFNLNMPRDESIRIPRRDIVEYFTDSPLTECGHWQASTVGESLRGMKIRFIYCSPALRSVQTANQAVLAMDLHKSSHFKGIRIEPALFEYTGWYSHLPQFLSAAELKRQGFHVDENYTPISPMPPLGESQAYWYARTAEFVHRILSQYPPKFHGNLLFVGHAGTADVVSYSLLTGYSNPTGEELELGSRVRLFSNYCGVAKLKYSRDWNQWIICDDSHFDIHNTSNEPFSFQLTYQSHERQYPLREAQLGFSPSRPRVSVTETALKEERVIDLNFRRSFGSLIDSIQRVAAELESLGTDGRSRLSDSDLDFLVNSHCKHAELHIESLIPEWRTMAAYTHGYTALHVLKCFLSVEMLLGPHSTADSHSIPTINGFPIQFSELLYKDKNIFSWALLLHDIGKELNQDSKGQLLRDPFHPFRSGALAARILAKQGFSRRSGEKWMKDAMEKWESLVNSSWIEDEEERKELQGELLKESAKDEEKWEKIQRKAEGEGDVEEEQANQGDLKLVSCCGGCVSVSSTGVLTAARRGLYNRARDAKKQDNSKLPHIFAGLDDIFGSNSACVDIVKLILLHQSIPWVDEFPPASPLSNPEIAQYFTPRLLFLSGFMAIADTASYQINNPSLQRLFVNRVLKNLAAFLSLIDPSGEFVPNPNFHAKKELGASLKEQNGSSSQRPSRRNSDADGSARQHMSNASDSGSRPSISFEMNRVGSKNSSPGMAAAQPNAAVDSLTLDQ